MAAYVREVKTASGATAVQVVWSSSRGSKEMDHVGSAHTPEDLEVLRAAARQKMVAAGQDELDFGDGWPRREALPIRGSRARHLWDALSVGFAAVGFDKATGGDEVFKQLVLARLVEPTSKLDSIRVLEEMGFPAPAYRTLKRRLSSYAEPQWRRRLAAACVGHVSLGPGTLVLYEVSTLYFETDQGDGFREPGYSKQTASGAADHDRVAYRCAGVPAAGRGVRGEQGRDPHVDPVDRLVHGCLPSAGGRSWSLMRG